MPKSHVSQISPGDFQQKLLKWYDKYRRALPWRALPGQVSDPYHVWLSEIMLQQTTVQAVIPYFEKFTTKWPTVRHLAQADPDDVMHAWAGLGYYARARNLLKCANEICAAHSEQFPQTEVELQGLPGIGPYTSAAISAIAFNQQATVIDGNVERVISRVKLIEEPLPLSKPEIRKEAHILFQGVSRPGDFAQAMMDLGATVCTPQSPKCGVCPVNDLCAAYAAGRQSELPAKQVKKARPKRTGQVFWLTTADGMVVTEKRSDSRMLGGMRGLPTSDWDQAGDAFPTTERLIKRLSKTGVIHHTFTHFDLTLEILEGAIKAAELPKAGGWILVPQSDIKEVGFPTVFRKVVRLQSSKPGIT